MFLAEPPPSQGDLHFRVLGIPVRIHPLFWLVILVFRLRDAPGEIAIWMIAVVVSVVIHELGHALTQRHFGGRPRIVLYSLGGLAICEDCDRSSRAQILISLAGPAAGFAFALLLLVLLRVMGQGVALEVANRVIYQVGNVEGATGIRLLGVGIYWQELVNSNAQRMVGNLLFINILWGLVNLLPIYPLDGGRISREVCQIGNPRGGIINSLRISVFASVAMMVLSLFAWQSFFTAIMFGYLAYSSYQTLEAYRQSLW